MATRRIAVRQERLVVKEKLDIAPIERIKRATFEPGSINMRNFIIVLRGRIAGGG